MQGFVHLTLFALLFVISARAATSPIPSVITNNNIAAPGNITTPAGTSNTTALWAAAGADTTTAAPAPTTTTAAAGANTTTAAPAPTTTTVAAGANTTTGAPAPATTTAAAGANTTTGAPAPPTTTAAAGANTTTGAPAPPTTTAAAGANTTTGAPAPPTTTAAAGANTTTAAPAPPTTTAAAGTSNTTAAPASTIAPRDLCRDDSCTGGAFCVNLNNTHFCQCVDGYYYTSSSCKKGKVFPGVIQVKTADTSELENKMSVNYEKLHMEVNKFFKDVFTNSDYEQTIIQQVSPSAPARPQLRAGDAVVSVTVVNLFAENTKENERTISNKIHSAISNSSSIAGYTNQDRCDFYHCKNESDCSNGFQCECQAGYERPDPYTAICLPLTRKCPYACDSKPNTQCLAKNDGSPDCVCLAGYKKDDREKCQACAFGYSGVNCEDNFQLILTVLGTVAGVLILGMVIALIFTRSKKTKDIEEQNLIQNDFQNLKLQQTTGFSYPSEGHIFPKITASFPRDGGMQNPYVTPRGIPRPDY